jgi:hypothetical protein
MSTLTQRKFTPTRAAAPSTPPVQQAWFTTGEAATYCRMSTKQLLRYATAGLLQGEQVAGRGGRWRFHIDQLNAFLTGS